MLTAMMTSLKPYLLLIKIGLVVAVFLGGVYAGYQWKGGRDEAKLAKAAADVTFFQAQSAASAQALVDMNKQAQANAAQAEKQRALAEKAASEASSAKAKLNTKQIEWEEEFERVYKTPDCKRILEQNLCPLITDY